MDGNSNNKFPIRFLDSLLKSISQCLILTDSEGKVLFTNPVLAETFGYKPDELAGQSISILFHDDDLNQLYPNLLHLAGQGKPFSGEVLLLRKDYSDFFAQMSMRPEHDPESGSSYIMFLISDVDLQKHLEQAVRKDRYEDLIKVANGVAHELRNPLVGIGGFINRLYKDHKDDQIQDSRVYDKYYELIMANLKKIENVVNKVEFLVSIPKPELELESVKDVVSSAVQPYIFRFDAERITFKTEINEAEFYLDKRLVKRALGTLFENSLDAIPTQGGEVFVQGGMSIDKYLLKVSDTGSGISEEDMPHIFNPFFSTRADGVGMDLALLKRIMELHGGKVTAVSTLGKGSEFLLEFPLERRRLVRSSLLID